MPVMVTWWGALLGVAVSGFFVYLAIQLRHGGDPRYQLRSSYWWAALVPIAFVLLLLFRGEMLLSDARTEAVASVVGAVFFVLIALRARRMGDSYWWGYIAGSAIVLLLALVPAITNIPYSGPG